MLNSTVKKVKLPDSNSERGGVRASCGTALLVTDMSGNCYCYDQQEAKATTEASQIEHAGEDRPETRCGPSCVAVGLCVCNTDKGAKLNRSSQLSQREV